MFLIIIIIIIIVGNLDKLVSVGEAEGKFLWSFCFGETVGTTPSGDEGFWSAVKASVKPCFPKTVMFLHVYRKPAAENIKAKKIKDKTGSALPNHRC